MQQLITSTYEHHLQYAYHQIDKRGLYMDAERLKKLRTNVAKQIKDDLKQLSDIWGCHVYIGKDNNDGSKGSINVNSSTKLLPFLKSKGYEIPKVKKKDAETREIEYKESVCEIAVRKIFSECGTDLSLAQPIGILLDLQKLKTLKSRYIDARLFDNTFFSNYNVAGTTSGRRSCKKNPFGLGNNAQNLPKYTANKLVQALFDEYRKCIIARPNHLLFFVDQMSAEDWPVSALSNNTKALEELRNQVDRHSNLASFIFNIPIGSRTSDEWKSSIERQLGKKTRHAFNYRMQPRTMSELVAKEGFSISPQQCKLLLERIAVYDPSVKGVFHTYIQDTLFKEHKLVTPFGRERYFLGLRNESTNHSILSEAISFIPQSTVGDNTGLAVLYLHGCNSVNGQSFQENITHENHDSIGQEVPDKQDDILQVFEATGAAFDRQITFYNGITVQIPIEGEIGYNFKETVKLKSYTKEGLYEALHKLKSKYHNASEDYELKEASNGETTKEAVAQ